MLNYVQSFRDQKDCKGHPAQLVVDILASADAGVSERHSQLLENWYAEYAKSRGMRYLYKNSSVESCLMINGWFFFPTSVKYVVLKGILVFSSNPTSPRKWILAWMMRHQKCQSHAWGKGGLRNNMFRVKDKTTTHMLCYCYVMLCKIRLGNVLLPDVLGTSANMFFYIHPQKQNGGLMFQMMGFLLWKIGALLSTACFFLESN